MAGQTPVIRALINALDQNRLHHAYLFTGTRGVGKTTIARILAKCLNCEQGVQSSPCGQCSSCQEIDSGRFLDLIEVDAASRTKVEDTRELLDNVQYAPSKGRYKIYLIDEVHMLSGHSFNALLKTLEEPPAHVKFLLATTDPQRLPITVLSRCLQLHLKNLPPEQILKQLEHILTEEKISYETAALRQLARAASGSLRDALSLLDQAIAYGDGQVCAADVNTMLNTAEPLQILNLLQALIKQNGPELFKIIAALAESAADFANVLDELMSVLHQIAIMQTVPEIENNLLEEAQLQQQLAELVQQLSPEDVQLYYQIAVIGRRDLALAPTSRSGFEMVMLRMLAFHPQNQAMPSNRAPSSSTPIQNHQSTPVCATQPPVFVKTATPITAPQPVISTDWRELLAKLSLRGASLAIASHCSLVKLTDDEIHLLLEPQHASLLSKALEQRMSDALQAYMQKPVKLMISTGKAEQQTPAQLDRLAHEAKHAKALETIVTDKNAQSLAHAFDGRIVPDSITIAEE